MPGYAHTERTSQQKPAVRHEHGPGGHRHAVTEAPAAALNRSPRSQSLAQLRAALDASPRVRSQLALQRALDKRKRPPLQKKPNATGLPDRLKAGVEQLSGLALDDVRVHYNSQKPAAVQAHAYAQGSDIHLAPGQEKHLPHEAWHVVQQKQGRVTPTLQLKGVAINDDAALEREADAMGARALERARVSPTSRLSHRAESGSGQVAQLRTEVMQLGGGFSKAAPTKTYSKGAKVYRADLRSKEKLEQAGGMNLRAPRGDITEARIIFYMVCSVFNPGILSASRTYEAAYDFGVGLYTGQPEYQQREPVYIYEMKVEGKKAVTMTNNRFIQWLYSGEEEEMLIENVPFKDLELVHVIGKSEVDKINRE